MAVDSKTALRRSPAEAKNRRSLSKLGHGHPEHAKRAAAAKKLIRGACATRHGPRARARARTRNRNLTGRRRRRRARARGAGFEPGSFSSVVGTAANRAKPSVWVPMGWRAMLYGAPSTTSDVLGDPRLLHLVFFTVRIVGRR